MPVDGYSVVTTDPRDGWRPYKPPKPARKPTRKPTRPKLTRPVRPVKPKFVDPFAPLTDEQLRARAGKMTNESLAPLLANLKTYIEGRSRAGQEAIRGTTSALGSLLQGVAPQIAQAYGAAQQAQSQTNSELANRLGAFGQQLGQEQAGKLALQGAPASVTPDTPQVAQGAANANYAVGSAEIGRLIGDSAAGQAYGAKLPGIAALKGIQSAKELELSLSQEFAEKSGELTARGQSMLVDLYDKLVEREFQKALAKQSGQFNSQKALADAAYKAQQMAYRKADLAYRKAKAKADRAAANARAANVEAGRNSRAANAEAGKNARAANANKNKANDPNYYWGINPATGKRVRIPKGYHYNKKGELVSIGTGKGGGGNRPPGLKPRGGK